MGQMNTIVKKYALGIAIVLFTSFFFHASAMENLGEELRSVIVSSFKVDLDLLEWFPEYNIVPIYLRFKINNPYPEEVTINRLEYAIYANEKIVIEEVITQEEIWLQTEITLPPGEILTLLDSPVLNFSKIDEETKELILKGTANWNVKGNVYFDTPMGVSTAPIQGIRTDYPPKTFNTVIYVKDKDWNPIAQAKVILFSEFYTLNKFTDEEGKAIFLNLPYPNYTLTLKVSKEGYFPYEKSIDVSEPEPPTGEIVELYLITKLTIEVKDEAGKPISNANVIIASKEAGNFSKITNEYGIAEFEIPRANYTLSVSKRGYLLHEETLDLSKSATSTKIIQLTAKEVVWWKQYWYAIVGIIAICVAIPIILRLKRKRLFR